jgi:hypothetical protein
MTRTARRPPEKVRFGDRGTGPRIDADRRGPEGTRPRSGTKPACPHNPWVGEARPLQRWLQGISRGIMGGASVPIPAAVRSACPVCELPVSDLPRLACGALSRAGSAAIRNCQVRGYAP